jgi:polysaccharide pyruvyl transferase WcaK-like protein
MPVMDARYWHSADPTKAERYRAALTAVARKLIGEGWDVFFFPSQPKDMEVIEDIVSALGGGPTERAKRIRRVDTVDGALEIMRSADAIVATRFHGAVLPMAICTPALAISYNPKTVEAMRQMGAGEWVVDFYQIDADTVVAKLRALIDRLDEERATLARRGEQQRKALDEQYDRVIEQLTGRPMRRPNPIHAKTPKEHAQAGPVR